MSVRDSTLAARSALHGAPHAADGWLGRGIRLREVSGLTLISMARHTERARELTSDKGFALLTVGPTRNLLVGSNHASTATGVDVSDQLTVMELTGAAAPSVLARLCSIDFAEHAFPRGTVAVTRAEDVRAIVWKRDQPESFYLAVNRSLARGFWNVLLHSCEVVSAERS